MNQTELQSAVLRVVLTELARAGEPYVPVMGSNRHVHLSRKDLDLLFGNGYELTRLRALEQPGQYACSETVLMETPKGALKLRVVGPVRRETQIELNRSDCFRMGVEPMVRMSGDTAGTPGCTLVNGERRAVLDHGVIVSARHLHMAAHEAEGFGLSNGDTVAIRVEGARAVVLENVAVRCGDGHSLEAHIDLDEANACALTDGQLCRIEMLPKKQTPRPAPAPSVSANAKPAAQLNTYVPQTQAKPEKQDLILDLTGEPRRFIGEDEVLGAYERGQKFIRHAADAVITPLARDAASAKGIEWTVTE